MKHFVVVGVVGVVGVVQDVLPAPVAERDDVDPADRVALQGVGQGESGVGGVDHGAL